MRVHARAHQPRVRIGVDDLFAEDCNLGARVGGVGDGDGRAVVGPLRGRVEEADRHEGGPERLVDECDDVRPPRGSWTDCELGAILKLGQGGRCLRGGGVVLAW